MKRISLLRLCIVTIFLMSCQKTVPHYKYEELVCTLDYRVFSGITLIENHSYLFRSPDDLTGEGLTIDTSSGRALFSLSVGDFSFYFHSDTSTFVSNHYYHFLNIPDCRVPIYKDFADMSKASTFKFDWSSPCCLMEFRHIYPAQQSLQPTSKSDSLLVCGTLELFSSTSSMLR